ncbi:YjcZ family sporulation protein [Sporosarcina sp. G11-34]|uniref:YjcZ family sporulation protein n=1 Tax=Sporosarcina sp. G11-34 TaxID=2849605 RepID=UPI0022A8EC50|nr:YjcZ family sporulation protein [Sporosarcina sp. G11-34]MCZ2258973.1 YjcZ family sporulation protein [Sporosarcina sp. G11-34]
MSGFGYGPQSFCNPYGPCQGFEEGRGGSYGGSTFVLIVVLFILLIIVGRSFC